MLDESCNNCAVSAAERRQIVATAFGRVAQLEFETVCERRPAAFGGSPPYGGGE